MAGRSSERTLPHNLEAERSVLGAILLHNDAFNLAAEVIDSGDFFRDAHRRIFDKMVKLVGAQRRHRSRHAQGRARPLRRARRGRRPAPTSRALVDGVPRSTNVEHYARIIKEKATLRNLIFSANKILATALRRPRRKPTSSSIRPSTRSSRSPTTRCRDGFVSLRELAQVEPRHHREAARAQGARSPASRPASPISTR